MKKRSSVYGRWVWMAIYNYSQNSTLTNSCRAFLLKKAYRHFCIKILFYIANSKFLKCLKKYCYSLGFVKGGAISLSYVDREVCLKNLVAVLQKVNITVTKGKNIYWVLTLSEYFTRI